MAETENKKVDAPVEEGDVDLHKKKRGKNLALLALVLGWVLLIWLITMVRVSHAHAQDSAGMFYNQRTTHQEAVVDARQDIDAGRVSHQEAIEPRPEMWWEGWQDRLFPEDYKAPEGDRTGQPQDLAHQDSQ